MNSIFLRLYGGLLLALCFIGAITYASVELVNHYRHYFFNTRLEKYLDETKPLAENTPDAMRDYIRHEALMRAYNLYFWLRGMWPPDTKYGVHYLQENDFQTFDAFERANADHANHDDFSRLFHLVIDRGA